MATADVPEIDEEEESNAGLLLVELGKRALNMYGQKGRSAIFHEEDERHAGGVCHVVVGRVCAAYPTMRVKEALTTGILKQSRAKTPTVVIDLATLVDGPGAAPVANPLAGQLAAQEAEIARLSKALAAATQGDQTTKQTTGKTTKTPTE